MKRRFNFWKFLTGPVLYVLLIVGSATVMYTMIRSL